MWFRLLKASVIAVFALARFLVKCLFSLRNYPNSADDWISLKLALYIRALDIRGLKVNFLEMLLYW